MAVRFDASTDLLQRTASLPTGTFTMMGWFKMTVDRAAYINLLGLGTSAGSQFYSLGIDSARKLFVYDGTNFPTGATTLTVGTWYHCAMTHNSGAGQALTGYLNGAQETLIPSSVNLTTFTYLEIGNDSDSEWLNGCAAFVKVWDAVLTAAEIQQEVYRALPAKFANLHAFWPLFPGSGVRTLDYSGNAKPLTEGGTLTDEDGPPVGWGAAPYFLPQGAVVAAAATSLLYARPTWRGYR